VVDPVDARAIGGDSYRAGLKGGEVRGITTAPNGRAGVDGNKRVLDKLRRKHLKDAYSGMIRGLVPTGLGGRFRRDAGADSDVTRGMIPGHPGADSKPPGGSFRGIRGLIPKGAVPLSEHAWSQARRVHERDDGATIDAEDSRGSEA
jgi:hypothetical protein